MARQGTLRGLTLSDLVRRSVGRVRTVAHAEVERERTRQVARIGNNLNQVARRANTHTSAAEAVEVLCGDPHQVAEVADVRGDRLGTRRHSDRRADRRGA